jgi:hypothetical protein
VELIAHCIAPKIVFEDVEARSAIFHIVGEHYSVIRLDQLYATDSGIVGCNGGAGAPAT